MSESGTEPFGQASAFVTQFRLVVDGAERPFVSSSDRAVLGTHESCDVVLGDRTVSRFHCEITVREGRARVRDLDSKNGTLVDGVSVLESFLHDGARLTLGQTTMRFHIGGGEVAIPLSRTSQFGLLVGRSAEMRHVFALLEQAAQSKATLLLEGETGTGKEAAAESVHRLSSRREQPFVVVDCSALPPDLLESELFGHEKGAFTGASARRVGAFEAAHGGTVFLDEVGELGPELQPKLLRVLERGELKRVGSDRYKQIDTRIIAATHRNLRSDVNAKRFRSDLYYRLSVLPIELPALRSHLEDVPALVTFYVDQFNREFRKSVRGASAAALKAMQHYGWPGNIRELRNAVERAMLLSDGPWLEPADFPALTGAAPIAAGLSLPAEGVNLEELERSLVVQALERSGGNQTRAATMLGLNRDQIRYRIEKFGLAKTT